MVLEAKQLGADAILSVTKVVSPGAGVDEYRTTGMAVTLRPKRQSSPTRPAQRRASEHGARRPFQGGLDLSNLSDWAPTPLAPSQLPRNRSDPNLMSFTPMPNNDQRGRLPSRNHSSQYRLGSRSRRSISGNFKQDTGSGLDTLLFDPQPSFYSHY